MKLLTVLLLAVALTACVRKPYTLAAAVATRDLSVGTIVTQDDFDLIRVEKEALPLNAPRKRTEMLGHTVIAPIPKGGFILLSELSTDVKPGFELKITPLK